MSFFNWPIYKIICISKILGLPKQKFLDGQFTAPSQQFSKMDFFSILQTPNQVCPTCLRANYLSQMLVSIRYQKHSSWIFIVRKLNTQVPLLGPVPHRNRDYPIGSDFWKFYLNRTCFTLSEPVSLVKVFRLVRLEWIVLVFRVWTQQVDVQHLIYWQGECVQHAQREKCHYREWVSNLECGPWYLRQASPNYKGYETLIGVLIHAKKATKI